MPKIAPHMLGILFTVAATMIFATQDGISKYMASHYNVMSVAMIRYWAFAVFVLALSAGKPQGIKGVAESAVLPLQIIRGVLLALQVCLIIWCFANIGLANTLAIFACFPLIVTALSVPLLGEKVGWRRWSAIVVGFSGVLIILQPGSGVFSLTSLIPMLVSFMFAMYHILTRLVASKDSADTSFFWTGIAGAVILTIIGVFFWDPMQGTFDWVMMGLLCIFGATGHYLTIRALAIAEASSIQPFFFLQMVFASGVGVIVFNEIVTTPMLIGAGIIMASGLFTFWRESRRQY